MQKKQMFTEANELKAKFNLIKFETLNFHSSSTKETSFRAHLGNTKLVSKLPQESVVMS